MTLDDLLKVTGIMDDPTFDEYWSAFGTAVRIAARTLQPPQPSQRTEINNTAASAERSWQQVRQAPAAGFGFAGAPHA